VGARRDHLTGEAGQRLRGRLRAPIVLAPGRGGDVEVVVAGDDQLAAELEPVRRALARVRGALVGGGVVVGVAGLDQQRRALGDAVVDQRREAAAAITAAGGGDVDQDPGGEVLLDESWRAPPTSSARAAQVRDLALARRVGPARVIEGDLAAVGADLAIALARIRVGMRRLPGGAPEMFSVTPERIVASCVASAMATVGVRPLH